MDYSVVVATRNRLDALKLSLPLLLAQTRPPLVIIVVDSTDAPEPIRGIVVEVARTTAIPVSYLHSAPGASLQRNLGLARARGAVTLFPDDDSMFFPDAMERVMRIYERDAAGLIGGVCASEMPAAAGIAGAVKASYTRAPREAAIGISAPRRKRLKARFVSDPFRGLADRKYAALAAPDWLAEEDAILVSHMTGFRMSFRTELIRRAPFDEDSSAATRCSRTSTPRCASSTAIAWSAPAARRSITTRFPAAATPSGRSASCRSSTAPMCSPSASRSAAA